MILVTITAGAGDYLAGDIMTLGDAQKIKKQHGALDYETARGNEGRWRSLGDQADPRFYADLGQSETVAGDRGGEIRGEPTGGSDPDEAMGRVGQEVGRKRGRPRRNA